MIAKAKKGRTLSGLPLTISIVVYSALVRPYQTGRTEMFLRKKKGRMTVNNS